MNSSYLQFIHITEDEVLAELRSLDPRKGPGADNIPALFIKESALALSVPVTLLFLETGQFPDVWRTALVVPIFKSSISIISAISKIFENVVYNHFYPLIKHYIISEQHGFFHVKISILQ